MSPDLDRHGGRSRYNLFMIKILSFIPAIVLLSLALTSNRMDEPYITIAGLIAIIAVGPAFVIPLMVFKVIDTSHYKSPSLEDDIKAIRRNSDLQLMRELTRKRDSDR